MASAIFHDRKANGVNGGNSDVGTRPRNLNTVVKNNIPGLTLDTTTGRMTFANGGNFKIRGSVPAYGVNNHQAKIVNLTTGAEYLGSNAFAGTVMTTSDIEQYVSVAPGDVLELQHYTRVATGNGLGLACIAGTDEIYSQIFVEQE